MTTKNLIKKLQSIEKQINGLRWHILKLPKNTEEKTSLQKMLSKTAGMLKNKMPKNPIAWQKKIRNQWGERMVKGINNISSSTFDTAQKR